MFTCVGCRNSAFMQNGEWISSRWIKEGEKRTSCLSKQERRADASTLQTLRGVPRFASINVIYKGDSADGFKPGRTEPSEETQS